MSQAGTQEIFYYHADQLQQHPLELLLKLKLQKKRALKAIEDKADAEEIVSRLDGIIIQIFANASDTGKLFGSVGVTEITQALQDQVGLEVDRKDISGETAKEIGAHQFTLHLHPEVEMQVTVDVQSEV